MAIQRSPEDIKKVFSIPSEIMQTSRGPVEYALYGEGPVLLSIHGGPGGYDQGLLLGEILRPYGFRILSVSRPGYLRTPLEAGPDFENFAHTLAELLDLLHLEKVGVMHASAGGPFGYTFANLYSDRIWGHTAIDSVCLKYVVNVTKAQEAMFMSKFGLWLTNFITDHFPKITIEQLLQTESTLTHEEIVKRASEVVKNPATLEFLKALMQTMGVSRFSERKPGLDNDLKLFAQIDKLTLDDITCPTLIVHGDSDKDVSPANAEYAHKCIQNSELYWIPKASHLGFVTAFGAAAAQDKMADFLHKHVPAKV